MLSFLRHLSLLVLQCETEEGITKKIHTEDSTEGENEKTERTKKHTKRKAYNFCIEKLLHQNCIEEITRRHATMVTECTHIYFHILIYCILIEKARKKRSS